MRLGLFYEQTTMVACLGFYIAFDVSWKGAHFFQYIQVLWTPWETYVWVLFRGQWRLVSLLEETTNIINKILSEL